MDKNTAKQILKQTKSDYNTIAEQFSNSRAFMWKNLDFLFQKITENDKVLDLGCGNGRMYDVVKHKKIKYIGIDNAKNFIEIAKRKYPEADFRIGDALDLPFENNYFDKIYSIAVFHHMPSKEMRIKFLLEAKRVLKKGGLLIITVWKLSLKKRLKLLLKFSFLKIIGKNKMDFNDVLVLWANTYKRYAHQFTKKELSRLVKQAGFEIKKIGTIKHGKHKDYNLYLIAKS